MMIENNDNRSPLLKIGVGIGLGLLLILFLGSIKGYQIYVAIAEAKDKMGPPPQAVTTMKVSEEDWSSQIESVGTLEVESGALLRAEAAGRIDKIHIADGAEVKKGDLLIELDSEVERAEYLGAVAQAELAEKTLVRKTKLFKSKAISQDDFDQSSLNAKALRKAADALKSRLERRVLKAPFDGKLGVRRVNEGEYVKEGDPLIQLEDLSNFYISFAVSAEHAHKIKLQDEVLFQTSEGLKTNGKVQAKDPRIDPMTKTITMRASLESTPSGASPGMFGTVYITLSNTSKRIVVPATSIKYAPYGNSVFKVNRSQDEEGNEVTTALPSFVKIADQRGDLVAISDGLKPGQEIVTSGTFKLQKDTVLIINNEVSVSKEARPNPDNS